MLCEEKVNGLAVLIHRAVEIAPLTFDTDGGFVHAPADPDQPLAPVKRLFQLWVVLHDPAVDGGMVDRHPTFLHEVFHMARAQRVSDIPADACQNNLLGEVGTFEADSHWYFPSLITLDHR